MLKNDKPFSGSDSEQNTHLSTDIISNNSQEEQTISSLEIATRTGKRHDHIIRDIEKMFNKLKVSHPKFEGAYLDEQNKARKCFNLNKHYSLVLVSGYDVVLRDAIIKRWQELETNQTILSNSIVLEDSAEAMAMKMLDLVKEIKNQKSTVLKLESRISNQNDRHIELLTLKATETRSAIKAVKDDLGAEINPLVYRLYSESCNGDHRTMHLKAQSEYNNTCTAGYEYTGAKTASLESKANYAKWLRVKSINQSKELF